MHLDAISLLELEVLVEIMDRRLLLGRRFRLEYPWEAKVREQIQDPCHPRANQIL